MTKDKQEFGLRLGILYCDSIEEQMNEQGYTLGAKKEIYTTIARSIAVLDVQNFIPDAVAHKARLKLIKDIEKNAEPIEEGTP